MCTRCSGIASTSERPEPLGDALRRARVAMALDVGRARIGVALSAPEADMALPHSVLERKGTRRDARLLTEDMNRLGVLDVVVGLPPQSEQPEGCSARLARQFAAHLAQVQPRPVWLVDEADSTNEAAAELSLLGVGTKRQRRVIDKVAAARILDRYLGGGAVIRVLGAPSA